MGKLNRKSFFKGLAIGTISLPFAIRALMGDLKAQNKGANNITSGESFEWKMVTTWPPNFPILGEGCNLFAQWVEEMSGGRMKIRVYGGGEMVPALEVFDAVKNGAADIGHGCAYYWAGKIPAAQFFASVPFGLNAQQMNAWLLNGGGLELWQELYAEHNLLPLPAGNTGVQMGGWFNREINSLADFKGLKMRMPGLGGKVLEKAGGTPVLLPGGELYTGLERGIIDATEWIGPYHDIKMGFHQIAKYYYSPGWHETGTSLEMIFNKEKMEALPKDLQAILRTACLSLNHWMLNEAETKNAEALATLKDTDVEIRQFPQDLIEELKQHTTELLEELSNSDTFTKKTYTSFLDFKHKSEEWSKLTERAYYEKLVG